MSALHATSVRTPVEPKEIGFYLYPGFSALDLSGPLEVFATSGSVGRAHEYRTILLSRSGGPITGSGGLEVTTVAASTRTLDTLIVVGASDLGRTNDEDIGAIRTFSATARRTASVCTGAFLVASAGPADGRRLATHWQSAERLQQDFPQVHVERDRLFVRDGPIWSSAGMTAAIDLALALVEDDHGRDLALAIARSLIMKKRRRGTESQRSQMLELEPPSDRVARVLSYVQRHPNEDLDERMRRAFLRRFGKCPQESPRDQAASPPLAIVGKEAPCLEMRQI